MSVDARVDFVIVNEDGSGELRLIDRPPRWAGDKSGIAGQSVLYFDKSPHDVTTLNGRDIWGGASEIRSGNLKIADRISVTRIAFVVDDIVHAELSASLNDEDLIHTCGDCGQMLTIVRPGKWQCDNPDCQSHRR